MSLFVFYLYVLDGTLEEERLLKAIETAVAAHPTLFTRIELDEQEEFQQAMDEAGQDPKKAKQMAALLAYKDMAHGQKTTDVQRDNDYTTQVLYRLGFSWSPTSWDYVERMLTAIGGFGFFE